MQKVREISPARGQHLAHISSGNSTQRTCFVEVNDGISLSDVSGDSLARLNLASLKAEVCLGSWESQERVKNTSKVTSEMLFTVWLNSCGKKQQQQQNKQKQYCPQLNLWSFMSNTEV